MAKESKHFLMELGLVLNYIVKIYLLENYLYWSIVFLFGCDKI